MIVQKIKCLLGYHSYRVVQGFGYSRRRIKCRFCRSDLAMNDDLKIVVPWDGSFEDMYSSWGYKIKEPMYGEPNGR